MGPSMAAGVPPEGTDVSGDTRPRAVQCTGDPVRAFTVVS